MAKSRRFNEALERLAAREAEQANREFVAPVRSGRPVVARNDGVICRYRFTPPRFNGWAVCSLVAADLAGLVREADAGERRAWLDAWPAVRLILSKQEHGDWVGVPARPDVRFPGLVPVFLTEGVAAFDTVVARYDGSQMWFDALEASDVAAPLRASLSAGVEPYQLAVAGASPEHANAYALARPMTNDQ